MHVELALPLRSRGRRELVVDALAAFGAVVLVLVALGGSEGSPFESLLQGSAVATVAGLLVHRMAGHSRVAFYVDRLEVRNPGLTLVIPRGEVVGFGHASSRGGPVVQVRDGRLITCAAPLPRGSRHLSQAYTRPPHVPRGPVRRQFELCAYEWVWLLVFGVIAAGWLFTG